MASVCRLCWSSVKKLYSQERLASRISGLLITLNHDDGLPNLMCAKCMRRVESLENHIDYLGSQVTDGLERALLLSFQLMLVLSAVAHIKLWAPLSAPNPRLCNLTSVETASDIQPPHSLRVSLDKQTWKCHCHLCTWAQLEEFPHHLLHAH